MPTPAVPVFARGRGAARKRGDIPNRPMKQGQVWAKLRDAFYKHCPTGHIVRIEDQVGRGTPDCYYRMGNARTPSGWSGWLELKCGYDKCTELQLAWHEREREAGGKVMVLTVRSTCAIVDSGDGPEDLGVVSWNKIMARL